MTFSRSLLAAGAMVLFSASAGAQLKLPLGKPATGLSKPAPPAPAARAASASGDAVAEK
jgi:hypothetical protein